jgi:lipoate-protein ligase A
MLGSFRACDYKAAGGKLIRIRLTEEEGKVKTVQISGDFFLVPEDNLPALEKMLEGTPLQEADLRKIIDRFFETSQVQSLGISADDLVLTLLAAKQEVVIAD